MKIKESIYAYPEEDLQELRGKALSLVTWGLLFAAGFLGTVLPSSDLERYRLALLGGLLVLLAFATRQLVRRNYLAGCWLLAGGSLGAILLLIHWYPGQMTSLLALPVIIAATFIGAEAGLMFSVVVSALVLWFAGAGLSEFTIGNLATLGTIWGALGLSWLGLRPFKTSVTWARINYEHAQGHLREAQQRQLELLEIREDLEDANRQLNRLNAILAASYQKAEEARRAKEQFAANVSHELRTPLNMIIGFSELITQAPTVYGKKLPRVLLADIAAIQRNAAHLSKLIDDVLDLSRLDADRMVLDKRPSSLPLLISETVNAVKSLFDSKGLYIRVEIAGDLPEVVSDPTRIRQVLLNLLSNAGRYTETGGVIIKAWQEGTELVASVSDTGPGIPEEESSRLFEAFHQLDIPFERRKGGSGLGLSISKKLVELHQGRMWFHSQVGIGTTFFFSLPLELTPVLVASGAARWLSEYAQREPRTRPSRTAASPVKPRLLFVDPEANLGRLAVHYLEGVEVAVTHDLGEAIAGLKENPAEALVLSDSSSWEAGSVRAELARFPFDIPVMICRASSTRSIAKDLGLVKYLVKPIVRETLLQTVERIGHPVHSVLVVDDEPEVLQLFTRFLASGDQGYRVLVASDGERALHMLREEQPDLVFLDLIMPRMSGFQFMEIVNQDPALASIPVVAISAQDPTGEPITSDSLTVMRPNGLSGRDLLNAVSALIKALGPISHTADPMPVEMPAG
ncbi:MAG: response regulator [Anaerolineae bacterium]|nr:response regulator [Anaerolineae bacterium]